MKFWIAVVAVYGIWCAGLGSFLLLVGWLMTSRWDFGQAIIIAAIVGLLPIAVAGYKVRKKYKRGAAGD